MTMTRRAIVAAAFASLTACATLNPPAKKKAIPDGPIVRGVSYVGISVSDLARSSEFYSSSANLVEVDSARLVGNAAINRIAGRDSVVADTRLLRGGNAQIRLMQFKNPSAAARMSAPMPVQGPGITHVCHQSPASKPLYPRFIAAGGKPVGRGSGEPIRLVPEVPVRYAYTRDFDAVMFENEIMEIDPPPFDHRIGHVAIATTDIERTVKFYNALLGREPRERRFNLARPTLDQTANLDNVKLNVAWYTIGNLELEVWQYLNPAPAPLDKPRPLDALGYNMIVFDVSDVAAASARLVAAGGTIEGKPVTMDGGRAAYGRDPDGNLIGLLSPASGSAFSSANFKSRETPPARPG